MQPVKIAASFINNLSLMHVKMYHPGNFRHRFEHGLSPDQDPNVPAAALELGFAQSGARFGAD